MSFRKKFGLVSIVIIACLAMLLMPLGTAAAAGEELITPDVPTEDEFNWSQIDDEVS
ncbi:MAG: hypothetical protein GX307_06045, partial [Euryarchaeota archaeon]|nr:hypothetical protein [Euryarchaeota archaeon]